MAAVRCSCIYCNSRNDYPASYVTCKIEHSCCHVCDCCPGDIFMWDTVGDFIKCMHGDDYLVELDKKIGTYIQSLINNCPLPDTYLDEDKALGCHIKKYIDNFSPDSFYNLLTSILDKNFEDDTVSAIIKHYSFRNTNGNGFDLSIECIKRGKMDYLAHYYKNIEPNVHANALRNRMYSIVKFLSSNSEFNTTDNIIKLHEIYGKENFDKAMVEMLSNVLYHSRLDNLPSQLTKLDCSCEHRIDNFDALNALPPFISSLKFPSNFTGDDLNIVQNNCPEFKAVKEYYNNYIQDSNILNSLLIDNRHIHNIYDENRQLFVKIESAITL